MKLRIILLAFTAVFLTAPFTNGAPNAVILPISLKPIIEIALGNQTNVTNFLVSQDGMHLYLVGTTNSATSKLIPDRKSTRLNSSHIPLSRMPSSA